MMKRNTSIDYSDGDIEHEIYDYIQHAHDCSSQHNIAREHFYKWPVRYHLSATRGNLLRSFDFAGLDVLELGAGMGGISRVIAETAEHLTMVEGTEQRLSAAKARLYDLNNWESFLCNIQDFNSRRLYDVICLIGVFEYSELYIDADNPFAWVLEKIKNSLKPDGVVVLAIENKNGLKYFSGASEDHSGKHFDSIYGYSHEKSVRTFSYKEFLKIFSDAGFEAVKTYFPHPDYKMPKALFSEKMFSLYPQKASQIMATTLSEDYSGAHRRLFSEAMVWENLASSGLLSDMANSFLFVVSQDKLSKKLEKLQGRYVDNLLCTSFSMDRLNPVRTDFFESGSTIQVRKNDIKSGNLIFEYPFYDGELLALVILRKMHFEGQNVAFKEIASFIHWVFTKFKTNSDFSLAGSAIDALPHNAIKNKNQYFLFDLEWESSESLTKSWYIYRLVLVLESYFQMFSTYDKDFLFERYYAIFCKMFSLKNDFYCDMAKEKKFGESVSGDLMLLDDSPNIFERFYAKFQKCARRGT